MRLVVCVPEPKTPPPPIAPVPRISIDKEDTNPDVIMAYAKTQGAVFVNAGEVLTFRILGHKGEPADICEATLRAYLDPTGTCKKNAEEAAKKTAETG